MSLPSDFCSERSSSKRTPDDLRRSSADRRASTRATSSPRARWDARTRSGSSRSRRRSITRPRLPVRGEGPRLTIAGHGLRTVMRQLLTVSIKGSTLPGKGHDPGVGLTRLPCGERDLGRDCPQGSTPSGELSTGCAEGLWISELITPKQGDHAADSRRKPLLTHTFEWKVVAPKDCARENSGRRVMCVPVDEDGVRRPICRQGGPAVSTCPQVEKPACG